MKTPNVKDNVSIKADNTLNVFMFTAMLSLLFYPRIITSFLTLMLCYPILDYDILVNIGVNIWLNDNTNVTVLSSWMIMLKSGR
jgi:hypothetical protein